MELQLSQVSTIGVISDIHSNYTALEAVLDRMVSLHADAFLFLGDYITDGPDPQRTLSLLRQAASHIPSVFIRGNREQYLIDHADRPDEIWKPGTSQGALLYTYQQLSPEDIRWFRSLPICHSFDDLVICHGSPRQINELLDVDETRAVSLDPAKTWLNRIDQSLMLCGHTHRQGLLSQAAADGRMKTIVNAGSVGLPHNHDADARAAVLRRSKDGGWKPELLSVSYDVDAIVTAYYRSELMEMAPAWSAANCRFIQTGHNYILHLIRQATALAAESSGRFCPQSLKERPLLEYPAELWAEAARMLDLL